MKNNALHYMDDNIDEYAENSQLTLPKQVVRSIEINEYNPLVKDKGFCRLTTVHQFLRMDLESKHAQKKPLSHRQYSHPRQEVSFIAKIIKMVLFQILSIECS